MKSKRSHPSSTLAASCASIVALAAALPVQAEQFVLLDETYTATADNTAESNFVAKPKSGIPGNLSMPVDYATGRIHVELEVLEKPSSDTTLYNICFKNSSDYACLPYVRYGQEGSYTDDPRFSDLWQYEAVDWSQGIDEVWLILKNESEAKVQGDAAFYPYKAHLTLTLVSAGSTFDPSAADSGDTAAGSGGMPGSAGNGGAGGMSIDGNAFGTAGAGGGEPDPIADDADTTSAMDAMSTDTDTPEEGPKAEPGQLSPGMTPAGAIAGSGSSATDRVAPIGTTAGSSATPSTSTARSTLGSSSDGDAPSISSQLEDTSGCSVSGRSGHAANAAWYFFIACALFARRRSRSHRAS